MLLVPFKIQESTSPILTTTFKRYNMKDYSKLSKHRKPKFKYSTTYISNHDYKQDALRKARRKELEEALLVSSITGSATLS